MSKKVKAIIIGAVVLLLLGGLLAFLLLTKPKNDDSASSSTSSTPLITLFEEDEQTLESLIVSNKDGEYEIKSIGEKKWGIAELADLAYIDYKYTSLVTGVSTLKASVVANENPEDLAVYGLDKPTATGKTKYKNGNAHEIKLGDKSNDGFSYYFMVDNDPKVYLSADASIEGLKNKKYSYLDATIFPAFNQEDANSVPNVDKITVNKPANPKPLIIEKANKDSSLDMIKNALSITSPVKVSLNDQMTQTYVFAMFGLTANEVVALKPTPQEKINYGFNNPTAVIEMEYEQTKKAKLIIGKGIECAHEEDEELEEDHKHEVVSYYVMKDGSELVYVVDAAKLVWLDHEAEDLMSTLLLMPYVLDIESMDLNIGGKDYAFKLNHSKDDKDADVLSVTCNGDTVSDESFRKLLQLLYNTPVEKINDKQPSGDPIMSLTYKYKNSKPSDKLEVYPLTDRTYIYAVNGNKDFTGRAIYVEKVAAAIENLLAGKDVNTDL